MDLSLPFCRCNQLILRNLTKYFFWKLKFQFSIWKSSICFHSFVSLKTRIWTFRRDWVYCHLRLTGMYIVLEIVVSQSSEQQKRTRRIIIRDNFWGILQVHAESTNETTHSKCFEQREWVICISKLHLQGWNSLWKSDN